MNANLGMVCLTACTHKPKEDDYFKESYITHNHKDNSPNFFHFGRVLYDRDVSKTKNSFTQKESAFVRSGNLINTNNLSGAFVRARFLLKVSNLSFIWFWKKKKKKKLLEIGTRVRTLC